VFIDDSQGYISGDGSKSFPAVLFGIRGGRGNEDGWNVENAMVVNYMSAHDNNTLWDKLAMSNPNDSAEVRAAMNRIGATILMISKGAVFFQAGEEMLRSKPMGDGKFDENSYKSSDEINNIRWDALKSDSIEKQMSLFYKGLIEMRKAYPIFTDNDSKVLGDTLSDTNGKAYVTMESNTGDKALVLINPTAEAMTYSLDSTWNMVCDGSKAGSEVIEVVNGEISVPSYSALVLVSK
jgi:pullulanase